MIIFWLHIVEADIEPLLGFEREIKKNNLRYDYKCFSNQDQISWNTECSLTVLLGCMSV